MDPSMMIANVMSAGPLTRGTVRGLSDSDTYVFDLVSVPGFALPGDVAPSSRRWVYQGKVTHDVFIPAGIQGYEHIPQEFYGALDKAWVTNAPVEFPDPFLDNLAVQGA
jgi:hypothetical protein